MRLENEYYINLPENEKYLVLGILLEGICCKLK